jgi:hypothetical protein
VLPFPCQVLPDYKTRCEQEVAEGHDSPEVSADRAWFSSAVRRFLSAGARGGDDTKPTRFRQPGQQRVQQSGFRQVYAVGLCICFLVFWGLADSSVRWAWAHPLLL